MVRAGELEAGEKFEGEEDEEEDIDILPVLDETDPNPTDAAPTAAN